MVPKKRDAVRPISAFKRLLEALDIVDVGRHNLGAQCCQFFGLIGVDVARNRPRGKASIRIAQYRAYQAAALRACSAHYCNDLFICQGDYPFVSVPAPTLHRARGWRMCRTRSIAWFGSPKQTQWFLSRYCEYTPCDLHTDSRLRNRPCVRYDQSPQASVTQMDSSVRPMGGAGSPAAVSNFLMSSPVSGCAIADCTPTRTRPSA